MRGLTRLTVVSAGLLVAAPALADPVVMTFEGVADEASVNDFYNGGTDSAGNSGPNYGVHFSDNALGLIDSDEGGTGNFADEPSPSTELFFLSGSAATMDVAAGFETGFSFYYQGTADGFVNVYSGLGGSGTLLATLVLPLTTSAANPCAGDPTGSNCHWMNIGVDFAGTAHSVDFGGAANLIGFDNITLGSDVAGGGAVPEPASWAMMLTGFGLAGGALRQRRTALRLA